MRRTAKKAALAALALGLAVPLHAEPPPLTTYGQLPGIEHASISPSGKHTAILGRVGTQRVLLVLDEAGKLVLKFTAGNVKVSALDWAGDSAVLITTHNTERLGAEFTANKIELSGVPPSHSSPISTQWSPTICANPQTTR